MLQTIWFLADQINEAARLREGIKLNKEFSTTIKNA